VVAPWVTDLDAKTPPRKLMVEGTPLDVDVSPDGSEVALELGGIGIVLVSIDGGGSRAVTPGFADARPRFRRDGLLLYFTRQLNGEAPRVFGVEARGGEARPVLEPGSSMATPSPVGDTVVFLQGTDESRLEVFVVDAANAVPRRLSPALGPGPYRTIAFSRDGSKIALFRGSSQLVEIDAPSGKVLRTVLRRPRLSRGRTRRDPLAVAGRPLDGRLSPAAATRKRCSLASLSKIPAARPRGCPDVRGDAHTKLAQP
jgi:dipeptidyl aminopeptidase/acylaminoacyl peptidase